MKQFLKKIHSDSPFYFVGVIALEISLFSAYFFIYKSSLLNLGYFDANTRLNIARRLFDNLTPGFAQIGSVWPPFPQLLFLPFVTIDYLWRSGIAGWIVSGMAYIATTLIMYKAIYELTRKKVMGVFGALAFAINSNVIYLQTTAMSESFFWLTLAANFYFLLKYIRTRSMGYLFLTALVTILATLTRYEGYAVFGASALIVFLTQLLGKMKRQEIEGNTILFLLLGSFGIILWSIYLWSIFGDPLYWLHFYTGIPGHTAVVKTTQVHKNSLVDAVAIYTMAVANMAGLFTMFFGMCGFLFTLLSPKVAKELKLLLLLPGFILLFMILTLSKNTPIQQPFMSPGTLLHKETNLLGEFNVRYGLNLFIYLILFAFIALNRIRYAVILYIAAISLQTVAYFYTPLYLTYQLRETVHYGITSFVPWFRENYHGGLILISAAKHDPEMIEMNLPLKDFIHEGTQKYWHTSIHDPSQYAAWIIYDRNDPLDQVTHYLSGKDLQSFGFVRVYDKEGIEIYKKST